jgi:hypothetical protein
MPKNMMIPKPIMAFSTIPYRPMPTSTAAERSTTIAVGQNGRTGKIACRIVVVTATTPAPKNSPTSSSAMRKRTGNVRPPNPVRWEIRDRSPLICSRDTASERTNLRMMPTVNTQMSARPYSAPEFIVVIMSEAPTLASANTMPGPMRRRRPAHDVGAEAAFFVCDVVSADIGGVGSFTWVRRRRRNRSHGHRSLRRVWPRLPHFGTEVSLPGKRLCFDPRRSAPHQPLKAHSSRRI